MKKRIGRYSFIAGIIIAIVLGLTAPKLDTAANLLWSFLVLLGLIAGLLNVPQKEAKGFLWAATALVIVAYAGSAQIKSWENVKLIGTFLKGIFDSILAFIVPATATAALKSIFGLIKGSG